MVIQVLNSKLGITLLHLHAASFIKSMGWPILKILWQRRCSILFSTLMFMLVVPVILTRNKRHCSRFRPKQCVFGLLNIVLIVQ